MRERMVPCREFGCPRTTWRDDAYCVAHVPTSVGAAVPLPLTGGDGEDASYPLDASSPLSQAGPQRSNQS